MGRDVGTLTHLLAAGLLLWFAVIAALLATRLLNRDMQVTGLLQTSDDAGGDTAVAPERVVAMAAIPAILVFYALSALHADLSGTPPIMPDIPDALVALLTGSNSLYLAGKIARKPGGTS
jgi:hypothetical protein